MWASRQTLPAPCRQQHRYLIQHVFALSEGQSATISGCARLLLMKKKKVQVLPNSSSVLRWCLPYRENSAPSPGHSTPKSVSADQGDAWATFVQSLQTVMHSWWPGCGADFTLCPKGCLVHHICWPITQSHTLAYLNKLVCQSVAMFKHSLTDNTLLCNKKMSALAYLSLCAYFFHQCVFVWILIYLQFQCFSVHANL